MPGWYPAPKTLLMPGAIHSPARNRFPPEFVLLLVVFFSPGVIVKEILDTMESLTPKLAELESQMTHGNFTGKNTNDLLGSNPQLAFSKLIEFKAAIDRMRGLTWLYMEAAANAGFPAQRIPPALREFLQREATKSNSAGAGKKIG